MKLTKRQMALALSLMRQRGFKTIGEYAQQFHASVRTLSADLKVVEEYCRDFGYQIERKSGVGIRVNKVEPVEEQAQRVELLKELDDRRVLILKKLLFEREVVTFEGLSEEYLVSKSSIKCDFDHIRRLLSDESLCTLHSDMNGTRLQGSEEQLQRTFCLFNELCFQQLKSLVHGQEEKLTLLKELYGSDVVNACYAVLYQTTLKKYPLIADYYMFNILNAFVVMTYRAKDAHHVEGRESVQKASLPLQEFTQDILDKAGELQNLTFTKADVRYLMKHLIANRIQGEASDGIREGIIEEIVQNMSIALEVDLVRDELLREQLSQHVPAMIYRLRENIRVQNPFLTQIKSEFTTMFHLTWLVLSSMEEVLEVSFTEDEIGFLMIYFQLALDRIQASKRVLIVCPLGISTSQLLANRVMKLLPPLDILYHSSLQDLAEVDMEAVDFIISTVPLHHVEKPYVVVSPLLSEEDMKNISELYHALFLWKKELPDQEIALEHLSPFVYPAMITKNGTLETREDILSSMCRKLQEQGFVKEGFLNTVLDRERQGHTDLATLAAIPHGNPIYVNKTAVSVYISRHTVKWEEESIRVVILLSIAPQDMRQVRGILKDVYRLTSSREMVERVFLSKDKKELIQLLGG